jgi:hypothetical protein
MVSGVGSVYLPTGRFALPKRPVEKASQEDITEGDVDYPFQPENI